MIMGEVGNIKELKAKVKDFYGITFIPDVVYKNGEKVPENILLWLLIAHEKLEKGDSKRSTVDSDYNAPGLLLEVEEIVAEIDNKSLQDALLALADINLGISGSNKKMYLAYPICRYADEKTMEKLTMVAPKWKSKVSGDNSPPLRTFRSACLYSRTRAALLFADKFNDIKKYAEIRNISEGEVREKHLSNIGLSVAGTKEYNLGNQKVVVRLQQDLTFVVETENGKTTKTLPRKGADEKLFATAEKDFSDIKKQAKTIVKSAAKSLFKEFLNAGVRTVESWKEYIQNPLLRINASAVVWSQGGNTFTLKEKTPITVCGEEYALGDAPICIAHPMEMDREEVVAWQKYFQVNKIKQPFEQMWEPVIDPKTIQPNRYADIGIPFCRFAEQNHRGISVEFFDSHTFAVISIEGIESDIRRMRENSTNFIDMLERYTIKSISFNEYNRRINHIIAYFDKVTVFDKIEADDVSVADVLQLFTLAQIMEFIKLANEKHATNVSALLLDYKNENFSDFNSTDDFILT